jgi:DNA repair exonuclease SbcCD ATPase subunit
MEKEHLKIIGLAVDGLRKLKAINMKFNETGLTQILGENEAGKTTLAIDAIQILIRGNKYANKDIVTKGKQKAILVGQVGPYKIHREIPKEGTPTLKVTDTRTGEVLKGRIQDFLDTFINELTFNPRPFLDRNKNEKLKFMMDLCKIDFSKIDAEIAIDYEKRKALGQEIDRYGEIIVPKKVAKVNTFDIIAKKKAINEENAKLKREFEEARNVDLAEIEAFNKLQRDKVKNIKEGQFLETQLLKQKTDLETKIAELQAELKETEKLYNNAKKKLTTYPQPLPEKPLTSSVPEPKYKSVDDLDKKLGEAAEINQLANEYETQLIKQKEKTEKQAEYKEFDNKINGLRKQKLEILAGTKTGVEGLTITEEDILYKGISSDNWSDAQGLTIGSMLCQAQKPILSAVFLDRAESMDKKTLKAFVEWGTKNGIQTIITRVADEVPDNKDEYTFYISEGSFVESEEE